MRGLRHWARHRTAWAALLLAAVVLMRLLPGGTMLSAAPGAMTLDVVICAGSMAGRTISIPVDRDDPAPADHDPAKAKPCAFAALGDPATGSDVPAFLFAAILFAMLLAVRPWPLQRRAAFRLRPPLRGPPLTV